MIEKDTNSNFKYKHVKKTIFIFSGISLAILLLFQLSKFSLINSHNSNDVYLILSGALFMILGIILSKLIYTENNEREIDKDILKKLKITKQEYKVLELMSDGLSNLEIAESLFISENTVKSHVSKIFSKLNAKRRTEAIKIGRDLNIL